MHTDILVMGSGIAGLSFVLRLASKRPDLRITLVTKSSLEESNTKYAQGGMAVVLNQDEDSFEQHIQDTLAAGQGKCNKEIVEMVVRKAPACLQELQHWGAQFDRKADGSLNLGLEGGHSQHRIVHQKDQTGWEIERSLVQQVLAHPQIQVFTQYFAIDLLTEQNSDNKKLCRGLRVFDEARQEIKTIRAKIVLLASGGMGQVFSSTTNPLVATGDGVAMALRAGAKVKDLRYVQFHPTAFYSPNTEGPAFLISEAVRGFGAHLVNRQGERFMFRYDSRGELATRDVVSQAIYQELAQSGEACVYLDVKHLEEEAFKQQFPFIHQFCTDQGIAVKQQNIPVLPAAHYQCGGISVDKKAQTSIPNLYAVGECACTGLHGANRLASNSLLEALVFSAEAVEAVLTQLDTIPDSKVDYAHAYSFSTDWDALAQQGRKSLQHLMTQYASVGRTPDSLQEAEQQIQFLFLTDSSWLADTQQAFSVPLQEYKNLLLIAEEMVKQMRD
ncbi:L-aspartate oxidase [Cytophagales bacterium LB-30]|uniref:L-aspartate oxidase n=1 Tax=Shiella aurantiaca TaxID=3058365 RepID=A0ABT8F3H4_9BACT|nr:L-aspartate oxidase [Shiella aurantiaca]MDN4165007.1 L-aspartate oxidase [Shiella aurantiaca]